MSKTKTLATLTPAAGVAVHSERPAPVRRNGSSGILLARAAELDTGRDAAPRQAPSGLILQRAAVPGAPKPGITREAPRATTQTEVNQSADFVAAGVGPEGKKGVALGHVEVV